MNFQERVEAVKKYLMDNPNEWIDKKTIKEKTGVSLTEPLIRGMEDNMLLAIDDDNRDIIMCVGTKNSGYLDLDFYHGPTNRRE